MRFADNVFFYLIAKLYTHGDPMPEEFDVVGAVGIGTNLAGTAANSRSRALAENAERCYRPGRKVLLLGGSRYPGLTAARAMKFIVMKTVPIGDIVLDEDSYNTYTNAREALRLMRADGHKSGVFFAEAWHARRARWIFHKTFRRSGIKVAIVPVLCPYDPDSGGMFIRPSTYFFYEWGAMVVSLFRGWM